MITWKYHACSSDGSFDMCHTINDQLIMTMIYLFNDRINYLIQVDKLNVALRNLAVAAVLTSTVVFLLACPIDHVHLASINPRPDLATTGQLSYTNGSGRPTPPPRHPGKCARACYSNCSCFQLNSIVLLICMIINFLVL